MRQGQQNRRGRGRNNNNNNNRKSQNPLMRSFESSGPDVKIRGTPSHIAEKYITLARDALSSGDPVLAENYLQHAEHYNRIILSYREQMTQQGGSMEAMGNGAARTHSLAGPDGSDDEFEDDGDEFGVNPPQGSLGDAQPQSFQQPQRNFDNQNNQNRYEPRQPRHDNNRGDQQRFNNNRNDGQRFDRNDNRNDNRGDRSDFRAERHDRNGNSNSNDRYRDDRRPSQGNGGNPGNGNDGQQGEGGFRRRDRFQGPNGVERDLAPGGLPPAAQQPQPAPIPAPERAAVAQPQAAQPPIDPQEQPPAFLRRPVRRPRREEPEAPVAPTPVATDDKD
jgi:hypothetical protein